MVIYGSALEMEIAKLLYNRLDRVECKTCEAPGSDWCWNCDRFTVAWHISEQEAQQLAKEIVEKVKNTKIGEF